MLPIQVTPGDDTPLFKQIIDQIRAAVAVGDLDVGSPLPSVRSLAADLVINPNTIAKAYGELVRDGVIESHRGKGYYVSKRRDIFSKKERQRRMSTLVHPLVVEAKTLGIDEEGLLELVREEWARLSPPSITPPRTGDSV